MGGGGTVLGLPHALPAGLGVVAESIILGWLSLLCIHGEKWLGRLGRDAGDAGRSFNFQALSTAQVTALDRLLTLRLSSVPFPAKHWAKRLLPAKNVQALRLPVRANFGTSLGLRVFINKLGRASTLRGCKTHPNQAPPAESPFLLQTLATDPEFFWLPLQGSDVTE